jgi:hypothetical protein
VDAVLRTWEEGPTGWLKAWATDAEYRGKGIASALLDWVEQRFRAMGATSVKAGQAKPHYYTPGIDASAYTPAIAFMLKHGFEYKRIGFNMDIPLTGQQFMTADITARMSEHGVTIRRVEDSEKEQFLKVVEATWGTTMQESEISKAVRMLHKAWF